jgi:hypothetical protein
MVIIVIGLIWLIYEIFFSENKKYVIFPIVFLLVVSSIELYYSVKALECDHKKGEMIMGTCVNKNVIIKT